MTEEQKFRDWLRRTYGVQDYEAYRNTQTEELAIQYAKHVTAQLQQHGVMQVLPEPDDYNGITLTCSFDGNVLIRILNALKKHDHELYVELSSRVIDFGTKKLGSPAVGNSAAGQSGSGGCDHKNTVSGTLPLSWDNLPEKLQKEMFNRHTHANLLDEDEIVYTENHVIELMNVIKSGNYR